MGAVQYAILLNGRLVGDTPFVFESRGAAARLVRLLGELTGARASAVQRGWCRDDAPAFDLDVVSGWLDRHGPLLTRPGHQPPTDVAEGGPDHLVWPPGAWGRPQHIAGGSSPGEFPPVDELPEGATNPAWLDGPDGSLLDLLLDAHDVDDWQVRPPRHLQPRSIRMEDGWIDAGDLEYLWGARQYRPARLEDGGEDDPWDVPLDSADDEWSAPASNWDHPDSDSPGPLSSPHSPAIGKDCDPDLSLRYVFLREGQRVFSCSYEFRTEAEKDDVLGVLTGILPGITASRSFVSHGVQAFTAAHMTGELRALGVHEPDLDRLTQAAAGVLSRAQQAVDQALQRRLDAAQAKADDAERARQQRIREEDARHAQAQARTFDLAAVQRARDQAAARERLRQQEEQERAAAALALSRDTIRRRCTERNIQVLTHFTRLENVDSILQHGLISHAHLNGRGIINDHERWDRRPEATCLSISSPNYRMFYRLRCSYPGSQWAVLLLSPSILWELDCGFTRLNAAERRMSTLSDDEIRGPDAFDLLFSGEDHRRQWRIQACEPTNPQAEVLCFDIIAPQYIQGIETDGAVGRSFQDASGRLIPLSTTSATFKPRHDYEAYRVG